MSTSAQDALPPVVRPSVPEEFRLYRNGLQDGTRILPHPAMSRTSQLRHTTNCTTSTTNPIPLPTPTPSNPKTNHHPNQLPASTLHPRPAQQPVTHPPHTTTSPHSSPTSRAPASRQRAPSTPVRSTNTQPPPRYAATASTYTASAAVVTEASTS